LAITAESINIILNKSKCWFIIDPGMVQTIPFWSNGWSTNQPPNVSPQEITPYEGVSLNKAGYKTLQRLGKKEPKGICPD